MAFNEWLLQQYGITSDDMTDEDYDTYYELYQQKLARDTRNCDRFYKMLQYSPKEVY